jgi:hypothetical protein
MKNRVVVGIGRTAEVLAWENGKVLKLYYTETDQDAADHEARVARAVQEAGIPCPAFYGQVEVDKRPGLIYEWIEGPILVDWMKKKPWRAYQVGRMMAELHVQIHRNPAPGAPSQRQRLERRIQSISFLADHLRQKALKVLDRLPDQDRLCHGDFHPGNITMAFRSAVIPDQFPARRLLLHFRKHIHDTYLKEYARLCGVQVTDIRAWDVPLAAARLDENIVEENEFLLKIVADG